MLVAGDKSSARGEMVTTPARGGDDTIMTSNSSRHHHYYGNVKGGDTEPSLCYLEHEGDRRMKQDHNYSAN